jgi:SpoVK/Ycf46/Vps4 family AAA+-type ATPase
MLSLARTAAEHRKFIPKGILLYGSPGGKKVEVALTIAKESGMPLIAAGLADVQSDVGKQAAANVHLLFEQARSQFPSILLIRDLDTFAPKRGSGKDNSSSTDIVSQWLVEQDLLRLPNETRFIFLLATTDCIEVVDEAVLSRLLKLEIPI